MLRDVDARMAERVTSRLVKEILGRVPDGWLMGRNAARPPGDQRRDYARYFEQRLAHRNGFLDEALRVR